MIMDARKQKVLEAIINDYIATGEPVGSRTIAKKYKIGVSPATIRNEMADLEEMGYLEQPHTSAGRIPSEAGYRYYVDYLMGRYELTTKEKELIEREYRIKVTSVSKVIQRTSQLISHMTDCAAVVKGPQQLNVLSNATYKHIQLIEIIPGQATVVIVMSDGAVHHRTIAIPEDIGANDLMMISQVLNAKLQGLTLENIKQTLVKEIYFELFKHKHILGLAMDLLKEGLTVEVEDKIYLGGVFNILNQPEFHNLEKVKTLLTLLDQDFLLSNIIGKGIDQDGITVRIGTEIDCVEISDCSMVMAPFGDRYGWGSIAVLGPTRMDYARIISVMEFMSKKLSETLNVIMRR